MMWKPVFADFDAMQAGKNFFPGKGASNIE